MKRLALLSLLTLTGLTLTGCNASNAVTSKLGGSKTEKRTARPKQGVTLANYETIKIALPVGGQASSEADVKAMFGQPSSSSKTNVTGMQQQVTQYTWTNVGKDFTGGTVLVGFYNGKAVSKGFSGTNFTTKKLTPDVLNGIQTGDSLKSIKAKLGTPTAEVLSGDGPLSAQVLNYTSVDANAASISYTFTNNKLVSTNKSDLSLN